MSQQQGLGVRVPELIGPPRAPRLGWAVARRVGMQAWRPVGVAGLAFFPIVALGTADGGFFPRPWGWATLGLAVAALAVVAIDRHASVGRRPLLLLGVLTALGAWIAASLMWTRSVALTVPELQRVLLYLAAVAIAALVVRAWTARALLAGVFLGTAGLSVGALVSYLLTRENAPDVFQGSYLHRPLGYANAMAIASVIALVLGLGIASDGRSRRARVGAAVALVPVAAALALTGSRAGWAALFAGLGATLALSPRRSRLLATWLPIAAVPALMACVMPASHLTSSSIVGAGADELGDRVLLLVVLLSALSVPLAVVATREPVERPGRDVPRWILAGLGTLAVAAFVVVAVVRSPGLAGDRPMFWRVAGSEIAERPLLGSGAGTYAQVWLERRPVDGSVRDAHSVVVEALAELGPIGAGVVCALLVLPLCWALRARARPLVPAAGGAFAAFALHASVDWDWEMPAVTLAGLFCAVAIGALADEGRGAAPLGGAARTAVAGVVVLVAALALAGFVGATSLEHAERALTRGDLVGAEAAARGAERWQPWAVEPLLMRGRAQAALGEARAARASFTKAVARDPNDYRAWLALATVSSGQAVDVAVTRARELNPRAVQEVSRKEEG
jgi:O-Antigen ligase